MLSHARETDCIEAVEKLCNFVGTFSFFFWVWAIVNTATKGYIDGGMLSFALAMASSWYGFRRMKHLKKQNTRIDWKFFLPVGSFILVAMNYALGAHMTNHEWNELYCVIFSGCWIGVSIIYTCLILRLRQIEHDRPPTPANSVGDEEEVVVEEEQLDIEEKPDFQIT